ncbi:MAG: hypothetical protein KJ066_23850 [Acidobacteria bacterium]|nr:hypothetical protein [Acidobacteriota bacterium]
MTRFDSSFTALALAALVSLGVVATASAQDQGEVYTMTAERSRQVQTTLSAIEADKAGFVHQLLMSWTPYVDNAQYDLFGELQAIALRAPAWQLYGASLVGDFKTMVRILRGEEGAGRYVNGLSQPEARVAADSGWEVVEPDAFPTGTEDNLVYVPIAPCRIVDTRGSGARTGVIPNNGTRSFDLEAEGLTSGQGSVASCPGLPGFSHFGWAANVTVTGFTAIGGLKAWGFTKTEPNASIINFSPGQSAVANGVVLTGCYACGDDITIRAFGSQTHVIIDVMGYFRSAETSQAAVTRVAGAETSVGAWGFVTGGACPAGTQLIGGELDWLGGALVMVGEMASVSGAMRFWAVNQDGVQRPAIAYSVCQDTPIKAAP